MIYERPGALFGASPTPKEASGEPPQGPWEASRTLTNHAAVEQRELGRDQVLDLRHPVSTIVTNTFHPVSQLI